MDASGWHKHPSLSCVVHLDPHHSKTGRSLTPTSQCGQYIPEAGSAAHQVRGGRQNQRPAASRPSLHTTWSWRVAAAAAEVRKAEVALCGGCLTVTHLAFPTARAWGHLLTPSVSSVTPQQRRARGGGQPPHRLPARTNRLLDRDHQEGCILVKATSFRTKEA